MFKAATNITDRCLELARLHIAQLNYQNAMLALATAKYVEKHDYEDRVTRDFRAQLDAELGKCFEADQSLVNQFSRTGNSVYPLP
jgi:hypothetical protein